MSTPIPLPGIVLAAGLSRRMGECKLTLPVNGRALASYALAAAREGGLAPVVVVAGPHSPLELESMTEAAGGELVMASDAARGQAESLKAGLARVHELAPDAPGVMVLLADQPLVSSALVQALAEDFAQNPVACVAPTFQGRRGHPVLLHRHVFDAVMRLEGDEGARSLLASFPLRLLPWVDDSCLMDVDDRESYDTLLQRLA